MHKPAKKRAYEAILLGNQVRYLRRGKDVSQIKLARQVKVSPGWIGRVERGIHLPNLKLLFKLAGALGVRVKDLIPF